MSVGLRLETKLTTKLALTPEVRTALELLQLPQMELEQRIAEEIEQNPLLEWDEPVAPPAREPVERVERIEGTDFSRNTEAPDFDPLERLVADQPSLRANLLWQIDVAPWPAAVKDVARELVPRLDPDGLLRDSDAELAQELAVPAEAVAAARARLGTLEPTGVGACDAVACMLLQLEERGDGASVAARLLRDARQQLESGDLQGAAAALACCAEDVAAALRLLRTLDPAPGGRFDDGDAQPIQPELHIEKRGNRWRVEPHRPYSRRVRTSEVMRRLQEEPQSFSPKERSFLREKARAAEYFLNSLKQRELTLLRVTEAILKRQGGLLDDGEAAARPLTLRDIADDVELHESTISRVTRHKYAITPRGLVELKSFFRQGVGGEHTPDQIKGRIAAMVAAENAAAPLSDQAIADALKRDGVDLARRTVAKYRGELNIPTRGDRKR